MTAGRSAWKIAILIGTAMVAGYFALRGQEAKDIGFSAIGLAAVAGVVAGTTIFRPAERWGWWYIATGITLFVLAGGASDFYRFVLHHAVPMPSVADGLHLAGYPFIFAGVVGLTRNRRQAACRESYADAAIVTIGALAVAWHFLMGPYVHDPALAVLGRLVSVAYPMMDLAILFIVMQSLLFGGARRPTHNLLTSALIFMLLADFGYDLIKLHGTYTTGSPVDAGWLISYVLLGAAAFHPSVAAKSVEVRTDAVDTGQRLPLVALSGLSAPVILVVTAVSGVHADVNVLAALTISLFVLVFVRMRSMFVRIAGQAGELELRAASLAESLSVRESLEADLRHQAFHDGLTGLANRALLHERIDHALATMPRTSDTVAVLICDLDGFKTVNDSLGHLAGDRLLLAAATRLCSIVRAGDTVARLGGDEYAVLLETLEHPMVATEIAERIVAVLREPIILDDREVLLSASVGLAVAAAGATTEQLISDADAAMYAAKSSGKNGFRVFEESMKAISLERIELTTSFRDALQRGEFFLEYQPHFALIDGRLEGFQALVRWQHPTLGLVPPDRFVALAEETGFIVLLGRWVLEAACEQAMRWPCGVGPPLTMLVNLSSRQLSDPNLLSDVLTALAFSGFEARQLILEISEGALISEPEQTVRVLTELQATGVRIGIDGFGTGYSSLSFLRHFPVEVLKIDKSFVGPLAESSREGAAFVRSIIRLAHSLGLRTLAEGIEHPDQRQQLANLGCDSAQGFLMGGPLEPKAASELVTAQRPGPSATQTNATAPLAGYAD